MEIYRALRIRFCETQNIRILEKIALRNIKQPYHKAMAYFSIKENEWNLDRKQESPPA